MCESFDTVGEYGSPELAMRSEVQYSRAGRFHGVTSGVDKQLEKLLVATNRLIDTLCSSHVEQGIR